MTAPQRRDAPASGDRLLLSALAVLIVGAPTVFLRTTMMPFYLPQLTFLWLAAIVVLLVGAYRVVVSGVLDRGPRLLTVASAAFLSALVLTSIVSPQPWVAITGLPARGAGAFTYLLCLLLLHSVFGLTRRRSIEPLLWAFICTHGLVVFYALLQAYGLDPVSWGADTSYIGNLVFSTLGNSNFSSGYVGLTLPLLVWLAFGAPYPFAVRMAAGAAVGASMVALIYFNSFQGQVAALAALAVLVQWAMTRGRGDRRMAVLVALPVAAVILGLPIAVHVPTGLLLLAVMVGTGACAAVGVFQDRKTKTPTNGEPVEATVGWFIPTIATALGMVAVTSLFFWRQIVEQIESGLEQRVEFWKVSLSIFRDSPLVGKGLETYLTYFSAHRSTDHAVNFESLLTDSPHSVAVGMLSGGGLVLAGTYFTIVLVIGYFGVQAVRRADGSSRLLYGAVLATWVAYQVQASVSMDVPGLIYIQWVLGGVLVGGGASAPLLSRQLPWKPRVRGRTQQGSSALRLRRLAAAAGVIAAFLFLLGPLSAPLRADMAVNRANGALLQGDVDAAKVDLARAIDLEPRNGYYAESMSFVHELGGSHEDAFAEMDRGARLQPGVPYIALKAAHSALRVDHLEAAEGWYEHAVNSDPKGARVLTEAAGFYARTGRPDRAVEILKSFESLRSPVESAWWEAHEVYAFLGVKERAERTALCATVGRNSAAGTSPTISANGWWTVIYNGEAYEIPGCWDIS